jgi:di/tricarboxylate transporter
VGFDWTAARLLDTLALAQEKLRAHPDAVAAGLADGPPARRDDTHDSADRCRSAPPRSAGLKPMAARGVSLRRMVSLAAIAGAAAFVASLPSPPDAPQAMLGFAIVLASVSLWATAALPTAVTGLLFFALSLGTQIAPPLALLSGFWSNAAGLVIGGFIVGAAAERSGLGRYVARGLLQRYLSSYPRFILGILIGTGALSFLVPSTMGRLAISLPIVIAAAKEAGYDPGSHGYVGVVATAVAGNFLTSFSILPANLTNVIVLGAVDGLYGVHLRYAEYLLMCVPVLGVAKGLLFWLCVVVFLRAPPPDRIASAEPAPLGRPARRLAIVLALTILLWATDFIHGIPPGIVSVASAVVCLLPPVSLATLRESFDLTKATAILSLAAVLGVATVLTASGAGAMTVAAIAKLVPLADHSPVYAFAAISLITTVISTVATVVGCIAIINPVLGGAAAAAGLPIKAGIVAELTGLQMVFFPYQTVPIMVGLVMGKVHARSVLRLMIPLALLSIVVLLPLQIGWLLFTGLIP